MRLIRLFQVFVFALALTSPVYLLFEEHSLQSRCYIHLSLGFCIFLLLLCCQRILSDGQKFAQRDMAKRIDSEAFHNRSAIKWCEEAQILSSPDKPHTLRGLFMLVKILPLVLTGIMRLIGSRKQL